MLAEGKRVCSQIPKFLDSRPARLFFFSFTCADSHFENDFSCWVKFDQKKPLIKVSGDPCLRGLSGRWSNGIGVSETSVI